jgi:hypothetical protein
MLACAISSSFADKLARLPRLKKNQTPSLNPSLSVCRRLARLSADSQEGELSPHSQRGRPLVVRLSPGSQQEEPLGLRRYDALGQFQSSLSQPGVCGWLSGF